MSQALSVEKFPSTLGKNTFAFMQKFIASLTVNETSAEKYRRIILQVLTFWAQKKISSPSLADLNRYFLKLRKERKSDYTMRLYATVIKSFFSFLGRNDFYPNITAEWKISLRRSPSHNRKALTLQQAQMLLAAVNGTDLNSLRDKAIIALALTCGLRTIEISRADCSDLTPAADCFYLKVQGKGRLTKDESVKVISWVADLIFDYLDLRGSVDNEPLFTFTSKKNFGRRFSSQSISKMIKRRLRSIGIDDPKITAHSCRHFAATCAIRQGADIREVAQMLRHNSLNVTMIYLHDLSIESRSAEKRIADCLSSRP
ncbi:MAG: tyrosine-type recombinase/integrase [Treponema sp.]|nr:tyrosine-type recombinase/integrase [Treponema sp.]